MSYALDCYLQDKESIFIFLCGYMNRNYNWWESDVFRRCRTYKFCNWFSCPVSVLQLICMSFKWLMDDGKLCSKYILVELVSCNWFIFDGSSYTLYNWVMHLIFICRTTKACSFFFCGYMNRYCYLWESDVCSLHIQSALSWYQIVV